MVPTLTFTTSDLSPYLPEATGGSSLYAVFSIDPRLGIVIEDVKGAIDVAGMEPDDIHSIGEFLADELDVPYRNYNKKAWEEA